MVDIKNAHSFGDLLRECRKGARVQLGTLATMLNVAPSYLSDVELGRRLPLKPEQIRRCVQVLHLSDTHHDQLLEAATANRGMIELNIQQSIPEEVELSATLAREWNRMSPELKREVNDLIRAKGKK